MCVCESECECLSVSECLSGSLSESECLRV